MKENLKNSSRTGLVFGVILIFIILIGFTVTVSNIFGNMLNIKSRTTVGNAPGLMFFFAVIGLWVGLRSSRVTKETLWPSLLNGAAAGMVMGVMVSLFSFFLGKMDAAGVEMRDYFVQLSRPPVQLLIYRLSPLAGSLVTFGLISGGGMLGGLLTFLSEKYRVRKLLALRFSDWQSSVQDSSLAKTIGSDNRFRYLIFGVLIIFLLVIPQFLGKYWNYAMGTVGIYVLMGLGLNIVVGLAGLLDLGYVAFFAIGAYTAGLLTSPAPITLQIGFWPALVVSILMAAAAGILLGLPVLRMRGDYLAIVTLGFGEIIRVLIRSDMMAPYLGGPQGVRDIAGPTLFGLSINSEKAFVYLIMIGIVLTIILTINLQNSRVGRAWVAMREDETVAQAMGINTLYYKLMAFATGAAFAGIGGVLFASRNQYTGPADHSLMVSINVLCLLIVGGMGSIPGVIVGAFVLKGLPEILRELDLYRLLVFGGLLVVMMILRPEGIWPAPRRRFELHEEGNEELLMDEQKA